MDTQKTKKELIDWIKAIENDAILANLQIMKTNTEDEDFWFDLPREVRQELNEASEQLDNGEYLTHEEVRRKVGERFSL